MAQPPFAGKPVIGPGPPGGKPGGGWRPLWIIAALTLLVFAAVFGFLIYKATQKTEAPLPAGPPAQAAQIPAAPGLPEVKQENVPAAPGLPETRPVPQPQAPVTETKPPPPPPPPPEPTGTITWWWLLRPLNPSVLGEDMGDKLPGQQFVALGVTIVNNSTAPVGIDPNDFSLWVDGAVYPTHTFATAQGVMSGVPLLNWQTLGPGARTAGGTSFVIPDRFRRVVAFWQPKQAPPPSVKIVRVDPSSPWATTAGPSASPGTQTQGEQ